MILLLYLFSKKHMYANNVVLYHAQSCEQRVYVETESSEVVNTCWALLGLMAVR